MKFRTKISFLCHLWILCLCFHSGVGKSYGNQKHQKTEIHESEVTTKTHKVEVENLAHVNENYKSDLLAQSATSNDEESFNQEREHGIESIVKQQDSELPGVETANEAAAEELDNRVSTVSRSHDHKVQQPEPSEKLEEQKEHDVTETDEGKETQQLQLSHPKIEDQEKEPQQKIVQEQEEQQEKEHSLPQQQQTKEIEEYNAQEKEHIQNDSEEQYQKAEKEVKEDQQQQKKIQEPDEQGNIQNMEQHQQKQDNLEQEELKQEEEQQPLQNEEQQPLQNEEQLKQHQVDTNASYNIKETEETNVAQELEKKNTTSNFENDLKNSDFINSNSDHINQTSNVNDKNGDTISKNKDNDDLHSGKEVVVDEVNKEPLKQNTDKPITKHQKKKPNQNRKKINKVHVQEHSLHPFAKAKSTLGKESKETETKINSMNGHFSHASEVKEEDNKQDSNDNSNKELKQKVDKEKLETEVIKTETMTKTEHNDNNINNEMDNSFNADKTQKKNGNKNHEHDTLQPKITKKTNKDQGPETIKDAIKINIETPKSSPEHKQTIEEKLVTKNENPVAEHEAHKKDQIVIKLKNEIVKEEDKPIEKKKQAHDRSATQSHHPKKKYSTAIIIVCLGLIVSTILLSIVGVYYRKVSMDTHRYYGHTLLPTEEDITLYTRAHYNEAADRYESWDS